MTNIPTVSRYPKSILYIWNDTKQRQEIWHRCSAGDREWVLYNATPCRDILENFIGPNQAFVGFVGLQLQKTWDCNGNPAPAAGNFVAANEIGGGLTLRGLGAGIDDWIAMHTGPNYPFTIADDPNLHIKVGSLDTTDVYMLLGLVGSDNLETANGAAWTVPDDGIWVEYDSAVDTNFRFITRRDAAQTSTSLGTIGDSIFFFRITSTIAELVNNGTILASHTTHLPADQLKPIMMVGSRAAVVKDYTLADFRLLFDHGDY